jgi:hypothetical protein
MVGMALAIGAGVVALAVIAVGVVVGLSRRGGESHSVDDYRHTLETLQGIREHPRVRIVGRQEPQPPTAGSGGTARADLGTDGTDQGPGGAEPGRGAAAAERLRFEDLGPVDDVVLSSRSIQRSRRVQSRALSSMNRRQRRLGGTVAVTVVVLAVLGALVALGSKHTSSSPRSATSSKTRSTTVSPKTTGTKTTVSPKTTGTHHHTTTRTTTTTAPSRFVPVSATATTATYDTPSSSYSVTFTTTTGDCWVNATSAGGTVLLTQTLPIGTSKSIAATGSTTIILGAPSAVSVSIDHEPVVLPTGFQTPFTMTVQPSAT